MSGAALCVCLLVLLSLCSACYISNCPAEGKRAAMDAPQRECLSCGPGGGGRCFGPSVCCGGAGPGGRGCRLGAPEEAERCALEDLLPSPCLAGGRPCGSEGGRCAVPGVCCDSESCAVDQSCVAERDGAEQIDQSKAGHSSAPVLRVMRLSGRAAPHRVHQ